MRGTRNSATVAGSSAKQLMKNRAVLVSAPAASARGVSALTLDGSVDPAMLGINNRCLQLVREQTLMFIAMAGNR